MKKYFSLVIILFSSFLSGSVIASAQGVNPVGLILNKWVEEAEGDNMYNLVLDSYVTGTSIQTISEISVPLDIVLVLDVSSSMTSNNISSNTYTKVSATSFSYNSYGNNKYYFKDGNTYRLVKRQTVSGEPTYNPLASKSYTFSNYGNNQYYYSLGDGRYSLVEKETYKEDVYTSKGKNVAYSYNGYGENQYFYKDGADYYPVTRSTNTEYNEVNSSFSYNFIKNSSTEYYYKTPNGSYLKVSAYYRNRGSNRYRLYYGNNTDNTIGKNASDANSTIYQGVLYTKKSTKYYLSYQKNNTTYYLSGTGSTSTKPTNAPTASADTIFTGELFTYSQQDRYMLKYVDGDTTYYLNPNGAPTTTRTSVTSNTATIYSGVLYTFTAPTYYSLVYEIEDQVYYLSGTGSSTELSYSKTTDGVIYSGDLYQAQGETMTRLAALKKSVKSFIDIIYDNAINDADGNTRETPIDHKISIIKYSDKNYYDPNNGTATQTPSIVEGNHSYEKSGGWFSTYSYTEVIKNLKTMTAGNVTDLKNAVETMKEGHGTATDYGMKLAEKILDPSNPSYVPSTEAAPRKKIVILFTDGEPNGLTGNSNFDYTAANNAITSAHNLKSESREGANDAAVVYAIGVIDSPANLAEIDPFNMPSSLTARQKNMVRFMNGLSSNYPDATACENSTDLGSKDADANSLFNASSAEELSNIFESIAKKSAEGGSDITLDSSSEVRDVLTDDFILPEDADKSAIKVYVIPALSENTGEDKDVNPFLFDDANQENYLFADAVVNLSDDKKTISVSNFEFSLDDTWTPDKSAITAYGNWVGKRTWGGSSYIKGNKLRIVIPITTAPDYVGGYEVFTNTSESGIWMDDEEKGWFPIPDLDFPSIGIIKNGMKKGESATFTVQRIKDEKGADVSDTAFNIILTGSSSDGATPAYVILKNIPEGTYRVAESKWSWTYDVTEVTIKDGEDTSTITPGSEEASATTQVLTKNLTEDWPAGINETVKCVLFTFTNEKNANYDDETEHTIYSEAVVKNKFKGNKGTVITPGSSTVLSKP